MADRPSAYLRDVSAWKGSHAVQRMTFAERGVYQAMLDEQWERRWLPDNPEQVADRIAITDVQRAEVIAAWPKVRGKFVAAESGPSRIYNARLEKTRRTQRARFVSRQEAGKVAGKASAAKRASDKVLGVNESLTNVERSSTVRIGIDRNSKDRIGKEETGGAHATSISPPTIPRRAGKEPPHLRFPRFPVFRWQIDALIELLGPAASGFELDVWFQELSARADAEQLVLSDAWPWIRAETVKEAQRRGFTIAKADAPAEGSKRVAGLVAGGNAFLQRGGA